MKHLDTKKLQLSFKIKISNREKKAVFRLKLYQLHGIFWSYCVKRRVINVEIPTDNNVYKIAQFSQSSIEHLKLL